MRTHQENRIHELTSGFSYRHSFCAGIYIDDLDFLKERDII